MISIKNRVKIIFLGAILIFGFFLRTYRLSSLPPGLTWDETALGYNAYSILKTARDEHGRFLPLIFKSFGDYKPGLYVYLTVPFVAIFGLNEFAVRLPSAIFGTLAILGIYLLTNQLFSKDFSSDGDRKDFSSDGDCKDFSSDGDCVPTQAPPRWNPSIGLLSALLLAISPWHLHFSHGAWEVNILTTVLLFSIYFFLKSLNQAKYFLAWALLASSTVLIYQGAKLLTPIIFLSLFVIYFSPIKKIIKIWLTPKTNQLILIILSLFLGFIFITNLNGPAGNRLTRLSIFGYRPRLTGNRFFNNQPLLTTQLVASRYLYHFSPEVLFYQGKVVSERGHLPKQGMLYLTDAFLLFLGFIFLVKQKNNRSRNLIFSLLFLTPLPGSLTLAEFSTIRALPMVIPFSLISALGLYYLLTKINQAISLPTLLFIILNIVLGLDIYFNHSFSDLALEFNYGYKQAFEQINSLPEAKNIVFTDVYGQPYIYYLFHNKFDPATYQKLNSYIDQGVDVGRVDRVGDKIEFHQFSQSEIFNQPNTWFVGTIGNIQDSFDINNKKVEYYSQIDVPNKEPIFRLVKTAKYEK